MTPLAQSARMMLTATATLGLLCALLTQTAPAATITVHDQAAGFDYLTGDPVILPAAELSTNLFAEGVQVVLDRPHTVRRALFEESGRLKMTDAAHDEPGLIQSAFPPYLQAQPFVRFLQGVRHYTNYSCAITTETPAVFYLLIDNRVNEFSIDKSYSDPVFGPPDTEWILRDGWARVDTGLSPIKTTTNRGDYVAIDEGNNGSLNQVYAIYQKALNQAGTVTLGTQFEGNIYCVVVSTNLPAHVRKGGPAGANGLSAPPASSHNRHPAPKRNIPTDVAHNP